MNDFADSIRAHQSDLPEDQQKKAGTPVSGAMDDAHKEFLQTILGLIKDGTINPDDHMSFINKDVYDNLDDAMEGKVDLASANISEQLTRIKTFYESTETPDESPQLQTMIEELWLMKERIEKDVDVFVF